jgi:hypothetical protein
VTNPILAIFWIVGLAYAFVQPQLRWIGWSYVVLMAFMIVGHGRNYYPGAVYPLLLAAGALALERGAAFQRYRTASVAVVAFASIMTVPFIFPVIAEAQLAAAITAGERLAGTLDLAPARHAYSPITENFADMHGWPELAATVASVYDSLPPAQRARAAIFASNYGEASAIDVYGAKRGLPPAISGHNSYWFWGPRAFDGSVLLEVNGTCGPEFRSARVAIARSSSEWAMPAENGLPISVCYGLEESVAQFWAAQRHFI